MVSDYFVPRHGPVAWTGVSSTDLRPLFLLRPSTTWNPLSHTRETDFGGRDMGRVYPRTSHPGGGGGEGSEMVEMTPETGVI